jgi:hypothetical protein
MPSLRAAKESRVFILHVVNHAPTVVELLLEITTSLAQHAVGLCVFTGDKVVVCALTDLEVECRKQRAQSTSVVLFSDVQLPAIQVISVAYGLEVRQFVDVEGLVLRVICEPAEVSPRETIATGMVCHEVSV